MMNINPIKNTRDLKIAFARLEQLWGAKKNSPEGDELEVLSILIENHENKHCPMPPSDPVEAILFQMDQCGLTRRDLKPYIGGTGRISEVLNRKRSLTLIMIKKLHEGLKIPYECLMANSTS